MLAAQSNSPLNVSFPVVVGCWPDEEKNGDFVKPFV